MLNILYFGDNWNFSTAYHRAKALERIGHQVIHYHAAEHFPEFFKSTIMKAINFRSGYRLVQPSVQRKLKEILHSGIKPDVIWVDNGEFFGRKCLQILKQFNCPVILYSIDDPTGKRDGHRFDRLLSAVKLYDVIAVVRGQAAEEFKALGAKKVIKVMMGYDEVAHAPYLHKDEIPAGFKSDVAFIGTWMRNENRDEFIKVLIDAGISVSIWGDRWPKSRYFKLLKPYYRGPNLGGKDYIAAIQGAKMCLGLLSKGNRDLHTTRSMEVPYAGGLLCAERTSDHTKLYVDGLEAVFWNDAYECASICKKLLAGNELMNIKNAGMKKVRHLKLGNEDICKHILEKGLSNTN
ncbi:CgeB family protein [Pedobacter sp. GR22-10]|uniref:CgeB family protein n=1 Tax=Pedobacter sp. GR22-10 TaxID=2994472 RepID=UPI002248311A|nr:glycosyltransferase [Pedobacter sp. GR22-10]MCX2433209.1 glycosyltransferase family 1 protein [Pedobacter sp. GR22-10]